MQFDAVFIVCFNDETHGPSIAVNPRPSTRQLPCARGMRSDEEAQNAMGSETPPIMVFNLPQFGSNIRVFVYNQRPAGRPTTIWQESYAAMNVTRFARLINLNNPLTSIPGQNYFIDLSQSSMYAFTHAAMLFALNLGEISQHDLNVFVNTSRATPQHVQHFVNHLNTPIAQPMHALIEPALQIPTPADPCDDLIFALELDDVKIDISECVICRDNTFPPHRRLNMCGHTFHRHCIREWAKRSSTCLLCRGKVDRLDVE